MGYAMPTMMLSSVGAFASTSPLQRRQAPSSTSTSVESGPQAASDGVSLSAPASSNAPSASTLAQSALQSASQAAAGALPGPAAATTLKVLSLNTFFDANGGLEAITDLIRGTGADLVGLQEVNTTTKAMAESLGMHFLQQDKRTALLSRFPIEAVTEGKNGVTVTLDNGQKVGFFNFHMTSFPNQPHQLMHLPGGGGPYINTEKQAVWWADKTRGREFRALVSESDAMGLPSIATGDFNEPSHLDWTPATVAAKRHPITVEWPGSKTLEKAGFKDSYREKHPDPLAKPGDTWTPTKPADDPKTKHDRIDFVMYRGGEISLKDVQVIGENAQNADIVIDPYPTDHRAVLATFEVAAPTA
jgi:exodeoxyribonuclease-3